ncbi:MAG: hypothetical protein O7E54_11015 [Planctomycetota bacterium]|nr:hypothetical protein [Planctomycetota bacterium]
MEHPEPKLVSEAVRQDEVEEELLGLHRERRALDVRAARLLARIHGTYHYAFRGCSSIAQYGEMHGLSGREARMLAAVGRALALEGPDLEERILSGRLSLDAVAALSKIFENPKLVRDGDDWVAWAEHWPARELDRQIRKRIREVETEEPSSLMTVVLTSSGRENFERARKLACRKENKLLSEGETVEVLSDHYLDSFDPERKTPRARRMADTVGRSGRHVPAEVKREVVARQGDRCAVPGCDHEIFMNLAHNVSHRLGGNREAWNLYHICREHNTLHDEGLLKISGTPVKPVFHMPDGRILEPVRAPP